MFYTIGDVFLYVSCRTFCDPYLTVWEEADEWYRGKLREDGFEDEVGAAEAAAKLAQKDDGLTPASG